MKRVLKVAFSLLATPLAAATISSPGTFTPTQAIVDFEDFAVNTLGPITVGDMTVSGETAQRVYGQGYTQYSDIFEGNYFGFASTIYTIAFAQDVTHVGFGLFDPNLDGIQIEARDRNGNTLESFAPPVGATGGSFSTYVGFERAAGDIASVVVVPPPAGDLMAVDNIGWRVSPTVPQPPEVPLPASGLFLVAGLAGIAAARRWRRG